MHHLTRHLRLTAVLLAVSLLLPGCADDSSSGTASYDTSSGGGYGGGPPAAPGAPAAPGGGAGNGGGSYGGYGQSDQDPYAEGQSGGANPSDDDADAYGGTSTGSPGYGGYGQQGGNQPAGYGNEAYADSGYQDGYGGGAGVDFRAQIEPILQANCYNCHDDGPRGRKGDLVLNSVEALQASGVVVPGSPDRSELFVRVSMERDEEGAMPPKGPGLQPSEIELIRGWIQSGARYDASGAEGYAGYGGYGEGGADGYGEGGYGAEDQAPPEPKTLMEFASRSFRNGPDSDAMAYVHAASLVNSEEGKAVLDQYRWVSGLKQPVLAVRWGIGVEFNRKGNWDGPPRPIGVNQDIPDGDGERGSRSSGGGYGGGGGGSGADGEGFDAVEGGYADFGNEALDYYVGLLGSTLIERLQMRIERGYYGEILRAELENALAGERDDEFGGGFGGGYDEGGYGGYGGGIARGSAGGSAGYGGYGGEARSDEDTEPEDRVEQIMPGVTMLGAASRNELFQRAQRQGVHLLLVFFVDVERNFKARLISNDTKLRLYDVATQEQLAVTRSLNNIRVQKALDEDPEDDTINLEIDKIFEVADERYRTIDFPSQIQPKHVAGRVRKLLELSTRNPLWILSESRFYRGRELLTDQQLAAVYKRLVPGKAEQLTQATTDDQVKELLASWLPADDGSASGNLIRSEDEPRPERDRDREFR